MQDAGVVDQHVQRAKALAIPIGEGADAIAVGEVQRPRRHAPAIGAEFGPQRLLQRVGVASPGRHDIGAPAGQLQGGCVAHGTG